MRADGLALALVRRKRYGAFNASFLEASYLAVIAYDPMDKDGKIAGFAAFSDGPREAVLEDWLAEANETLNQRWRPSGLLFLTFFVVDPVPMFEKRAAEALMRCAFSTLPNVAAVVSTLPSREEAPAEGKPLFRSLTAAYGDKGVTLPGGAVGGAKGGEVVLVCERELVVPTLAVRSACVEDHDDLAPLMASQAESLAATFGAFYIAELIEAQDGTSNRTLVSARWPA